MTVDVFCGTTRSCELGFDLRLPGITRPSYDDAMFCFLACLPRARGHRKTSQEFGPRFSTMDTFFGPHHSEEI